MPEKLRRELHADLVPVILDVEDRDSIAATANQLQSALDGAGCMDWSMWQGSA